MFNDQPPMTVREGCLILIFAPLSVLLGWLGRVFGPTIRFLDLAWMIITNPLYRRRHPTQIVLTEEGLAARLQRQSPWPDTLPTSGWIRVENRTLAAIRVCARDAKGWYPPQLGGQGVLLRPGQSLKFRGSRHFQRYVLEFSRLGGDAYSLVVAPDRDG